MAAYRQLPEQVLKRQIHHKEHYQNNKEAYKKKQEKWNKLNSEKRKLFTIEGFKKYHKTAEYKTWVKNYNKTHKGYNNAKAALRRARLLQATPPWANIAEIKEFYKNCPKGCHVDHIIPLKNPKVCGLHTKDNLQYLTKEENLRKYNKVYE